MGATTLRSGEAESDAMMALDLLVPPPSVTGWDLLYPNWGYDHSREQRYRMKRMDNDSLNPDVHKLVEYVRSSIIGDDRAVEGPFGIRRVTYADYTASGRSLSFIEDFIRNEVMPLYANTHTETSSTGLQTTRFREDARRQILSAVNGCEDDVVIFCGSGATGAINKLIEILNIRLPADLDDSYGFSKLIPVAHRPVVFIGPYEHHSNEISWRETIADVVVIDEDHDGRIDEKHLEMALRREVFEQPVRTAIAVVWCDQQITRFEQLTKQIQSRHSR